MKWNKVGRMHFGHYWMLCMWWALGVRQFPWAEWVESMIWPLPLCAQWATFPWHIFLSVVPTSLSLGRIVIFVIWLSLLCWLFQVPEKAALFIPCPGSVTSSSWVCPMTALLVSAIAKQRQWQTHCYEPSSSRAPDDHTFLSCHSRVICSKSNRTDSSMFFTVTDDIPEFTSPCCQGPGAV